MFEVRLLRSFATIADHGSFTAAARALHLSQPALSQQIKALEHSVRTPLFVRSTTPVRLTPAGEALLRQAYRVLRAVDDAEDAMLGFAAARTGRLRVGVVAGGLYDILHPVLRDLLSALPDARFDVRRFWPQDQLAAVRRDDVDVCVYLRTTEDSEDDLRVLPLRDDHLIAILPEGHPAIRPDGTVRLADLAGERFASFRRRWMPVFYDRCLAACHAAGFMPNILEHCEDPMTMALAVCGGAAALSGAGMASRYPGLVYAPVEPRIAITEIAAVWQPDNENPLLPVFTDRVVAHCGDPVDYWRDALHA
ncbi:LysR family transcriptional regulator [Catenulispora yoronensis]|uniref:LysR family transcriptional regulator n=1 Tax=Catenulispora yoronensis TaxID=450799 RepID=A0ABN2V3J9_9ACTN